MPISWMHYRNKPILFADYRGLDRRHKASLYRRQAREMDQVNGGVAVICRFDGTPLGGGNATRVLRLARAVLRSKSGRGAVVMENPFWRAALHVWSRVAGPHLVPFSSELEALEWVVR